MTSKLLSSFGAPMNDKIETINDRLTRIEGQLIGGRAVFMGNGRVLTKASFLNLIYLVDGADRLIVPKFIMDGVFEADVTTYFLNNVKPDSHCLDIGANFGYYTCLLAKLAPHGTTTAVEADPETFEFLRDNVQINWLGGNVRVLNVACSDAEGELTLYRRDRRSGNTSIIKLDDLALSEMGEAASTPFTVKAVSLETLATRPIDFMKVDVEGAEPLVFRRVGALIAKSPNLKIVMEWAPDQIRAAGFDPAAFTYELEASGLAASRLHYDGTQAPLVWADVRTTNYCNLLLVPQGGA